VDVEMVAEKNTYRTRDCRSASRRSSAACELSKGALRALRARARHESRGSGDWSDLSASGSRGVSIDTDSVSMGVQPSLYDSPASSDLPFVSDVGVGGTEGYFASQAADGMTMAYSHPEISWAFPNPGHHGTIQQGMDQVAFSQNPSQGQSCEWG
jgi:hypothetical protein